MKANSIKLAFDNSLVEKKLTNESRLFLTTLSPSPYYLHGNREFCVKPRAHSRWPTSHASLIKFNSGRNISDRKSPKHYHTVFEY